MKKNRQILVLAALLFSFLCFPADKVLAASNVVEVPLTVKQNFEENSNEKGIDLTGTYEFRALDIGIPMPGDSDNDRHVFVLDGNNAEPAHLYVWDEPLNYIDVYSRIQIEQLIRQFSPAMLLVEHDVTFQKEIDAKVITL